MTKEEKEAIREWYDHTIQSLSEAEDLTMEEMEAKRQEWIDLYLKLMESPLEASTSHLDN